MKSIFLLAFLLTGGFVRSYAQLGSNAGDFFELESNSGNAIGNTIYHKTWFYRNAQGENWFTASVHDGIAVDVSFQVPHASTRVWWDRNPYTGEQSWGDGPQTYLGIFGGNVGIGTTSPTAKLSVNGNIRAKEIRVEAANWPDYVFDQDYKILGLNELDAYIKQHKHLPDMPSAKDAEANGIELGDVVKKLLKNQEELTLHLIEKDKALRSESAMNIENQKKIEKTEKELAVLKKMVKQLIKK